MVIFLLLFLNFRTSNIFKPLFNLSPLFTFLFLKTIRSSCERLQTRCSIILYHSMRRTVMASLWITMPSFILFFTDGARVNWWRGFHALFHFYWRLQFKSFCRRGRYQCYNDNFLLASLIGHYSLTNRCSDIHSVSGWTAWSNAAHRK